MKATVLGSGSKGNVTYIELDGTKILIDCGLSFRQINNRLASINLDLEGLDGVIVTHEHSDHVGGLNVLLKKVPTTVFVTEETFDSFTPFAPMKVIIVVAIIMVNKIFLNLVFILYYILPILRFKFEGK